MKARIVVLLGLAVIVIWAAAFSLPDKNLHVVFCDVGQGDATLLVRGRTQILIDGGPNSDVVNCLARYMPFFDKQIELVVLTHPHEDHFLGLISVLQRYSITYFVMGEKGGEGKNYEELLTLVINKGIQIDEFATGDGLKLGKGGILINFETLWPDSRISLGMTNADPNSLSLVQLVRFGDFELLFTGDADVRLWKERLNSNLSSLEILKVPHHASRTALDQAWISIIRPSLAVVSVGKNSYGHPDKETLGLLTAAGVGIKRTDLDGDVEVVSDGKKWWMR